ncbi:class I SAM-dependent methyltransferase [Gordonia sp. TBRC 11910]|uniref:Class I SAM-dependent methyltransferase n=1 Tax=Gordonia asplenii TaxID=2725283 RepID=A0A848KV67_9ACTN|nr:class I SAM-dependent methyltransferase [Gordonia asplenii]NMO00755.1 class I SAM-dependent methyltransferase [Gordonia asplenii]
MTSIAQRLMRSKTFSVVYQDLWRPTFTRLFSLGGSATAEFDRALMSYLSRPGERSILDVACGPGNYTGQLARRLTGVGHCVGIDFSPAMLSTAVRTNSGDRISYLRADAHAIPLADNTFDTVTCLAALYLIPDPLPVIDELVRVCKPGGDVVIFTSVRTDLSRLPGVGTIATLGGYRMFEPHEITGRMHDAGIPDVEQTIIGQGQYVIGRKPAT